MMSLIFWLIVGPNASAANVCHTSLVAADRSPGQAYEDTQRLNQIFSAVIEAIIRHVESLNQVELEAVAKRARDGFFETRVYDRTFPFLFDGAYPGRFEISSGGAFERLKAPFTPFSRTVMKKLSLAIVQLNLEIAHEQRRLTTLTEFAVNHEILSAKTYAGKNLAEAIHFAHQSILSAVSLLMSGSVDRRTANQMFRSIALEQNGRVSLAVQLALALPPRSLGRYGEQFFLRPSLKRASDGSLIFSPRLRGYLKSQRLHLSIQPWSPYEFGKGCPVAHRLENAESSALQKYLDLIVRLMQRL